MVPSGAETNVRDRDRLNQDACAAPQTITIT